MIKLLSSLNQREPQGWRWVLSLFGGLVFIFPNALPVSQILGGYDLSASEAVAYSALFWLLLLTVCGRLWLAFLLASIPASWWACCLFLRLAYQSPINQTFLGMMVDTSLAEIGDFLSSYGFHWLLLAFLPVVLFLSFSAYLFRYPETPWPKAWRAFILPITALAFVLPSYLLFFSVEDVVIDSQATESEEVFSFQQEDMANRFFSFYPLDFPFAVWNFMENMQRVNALRDSVRPLRFLGQGDAAPEIVLLVIGESSNMTRWRLFGYDRQTNPLLQTQKNIIPFSNVVSASRATRHAVPAIVSRRPFMQIDGKLAKNPENSVLNFFSQAGYQTWWLSNQSRSGFHESPIAFYAADAHNQYYTNVSAYNMQGNFDEAVINRLKNILHNESGKKMIVLHTMGSHFNYAHRYPDEFDIFRPSINRSLRLSRDGKEADKAIVSNSYDNTIVYTDYIVDAAIEAVKNKSAVMIFSSDHAEDVPGKTGVCEFEHISRKSAMSYRVPTLVWLSEAYQKTHHEIVKKLLANMNRAYMNADLPQTLLDLAFIKTEGERTISLLDNVDGRIRYVHAGSQVDFDHAENRNPCEIK